MPVLIVCERCGKEKKIPPSQYEKHNRHYCSRQCHMKSMNEELNPSRMTDDIKAKLCLSRLGSGEGKSYVKTNARHSHRTIAEKILGRPLTSKEIVHHIDGNKRNNDPVNLMIFPSQKEHAAWHMQQRLQADTEEVMPI